MIDFRYHIVSIVAVFLALGVGILMGTTVLDRVVSDEFTRQVDRLGRQLDTTQRDLEEAREGRERLNELLVRLEPWTVRGLLEARPVLFVLSGGQPPWGDRIRDTLATAGATDVGQIALTDRWALDEDRDRAELIGAVTAVNPVFDPGEDPAGVALELLGRRLFDGTGRALLSELAAAGFLTVPPEPEGPWPPAGSAVVAFATSGQSDVSGSSWLVHLTRGTSSTAPSIVVSGGPENPGAVEGWRQVRNPPPLLATFDSGDDEQAPLAVALVLRAAIDGRGGHFGLAEGRPFFPEPAPPPVPTPAV